MFNLSAIEALKLMLDDKLIIDRDEFIFERHKRNISKEKPGVHIEFMGYEDFLIENELYSFKEYIEPKKEPRVINFESYIGENPDFKPYSKCPVEVAFGCEVSRICNDYDALKALYLKVSKVKVTLEFEE